VTDVFEEAEEGLRRDRWVAIAKKSAPYIGGAAVVALTLALGFWGYTSWKDSQIAKSSEAFAAAQEVQGTGDKVKALEAYRKVADTATPAFKSMALQQMAAIEANDNKLDEALKLLDQAASAQSDPLLSDIAALKAAYIAMDKAPFADVKKRLEPLAKEGRPYAAFAREALAMAKLQNGDAVGAKADLQALSLSLDAPEPLKQRAQIAVAAIESGASEVARATLKLPEAKMPAQPQMPPKGMMGQ
jgi:hypothetical protein